MTRRINPIDWRTVAGFSGLLFLIIAVGLIGIRQIENLSKVVSHLAKTDMPMQNAVLEMKSSNSKYAMGIRSYMFWRSARYLEAAAPAAQMDLVREALSNFDRQLAFCGSILPEDLRKMWLAPLRTSHAELRELGSRIITSTDSATASEASGAERQKENEVINRNLMLFESKLFRIDAFLDDFIQKVARPQVEKQLMVAEKGRRRSILFLTWSSIVGLALGAQTAFLVYRRSRNEKEHRDLLWREVMRVEEEEKNKLSFQIHDQMGQDLSALKIYLGLIDRDLPQEAVEQKEKIEKTRKILDTLMAKTHNISDLLRPPEIDELGISESIAGLIAQQREMTDTQYNYNRPAQDIKLSAEHGLVLYRVVQEALTNIVKHAQAKNVEVSLSEGSGNIYLNIVDDGIGFEYGIYLKRPQRRREDKVRLGLIGLRERIELLNGQLKVVTRPGEGTTLKVILPVI